MEAKGIQIIKAYLSKEFFKGAEVTDDQDLVFGGAIDSLGVMRLVAFVEESFGISIPAQDITISALETPQAVMTYVQSRLESA